jgi:hypothetical protein
MSDVVSTPAHVLYAETYAKKAAPVREKAEVVNKNALRDQLFDLARHYNFLAALATPADRDRPVVNGLGCDGSTRL